LKRTIAVFDGLDFVSEIAVAVPVGYVSAVEGYGFGKVRHVIEGGKSRGESVYAVLKCLDAVSEDVVLIHDGARPFVTHEIICDVAEAVEKYGAAVACTPLTDTVKQVDANGRITATPDRNQLWRAQTPQGFTYGIIAKAYEKGLRDGVISEVTDDSALVERMGIDVYVVAASPGNIKITTPEDMVLAEVFLDGNAAK